MIKVDVCDMIVKQKNEKIEVRENIMSDDIREQMKQFKKKYKITNIEFAETLGITPENFCRRFKKGNITVQELEKLGKNFNFEVKIVEKWQ